jgi:glutamate 5-kinase
MRTKLEAAAKAAAAGVASALFCGSDAATVHALGEGQLRGTLVRAPASRMQARKYWLRHAPAAPGRIVVDDGAARALAGGRASLLPGGIVGTDGEFHRGDMVEIVAIKSGDTAQHAIARGLSQYGAAEVRRLAGHHSREIPALLGYSYGGEVVHRDDMATLAQREPGA